MLSKFSLLMAAMALLPFGMSARGASVAQATTNDTGACHDACRDCEAACLRCAAACLDELAKGKADQKLCIQLCLDCADICSTCARIAARGGPLKDVVAVACAEACERCAAECERHQDDPLCQACAEQCHKCVKACRADAK